MKFRTEGDYAYFTSIKPEVSLFFACLFFCCCLQLKTGSGKKKIIYKPSPQFYAKWDKSIELHIWVFRYETSQSLLTSFKNQMPKT